MVGCPEGGEGGGETAFIDLSAVAAGKNKIIKCESQKKGKERCLAHSPSRNKYTIKTFHFNNTKSGL